MLKFYWNGIKATNDSPLLQTCSYSTGNFTERSGLPADAIRIYKREYRGFTAEIREAFEVKNDSDGMTDYFETDSLTVLPSHPLYSQVLEACKARDAYYAKVQAKREAKYQARKAA